MYVLVAQSCPTICDPMDCSPLSSSVHGILQARILEWVAISFSRDIPDPDIEPGSPALQADSLLSEPPGKPWLRNSWGKLYRVPVPMTRTRIIGHHSWGPPLTCMTPRMIFPYILCHRNLACLILVPILPGARPTPRDSNEFGSGRCPDTSIFKNMMQGANMCNQSWESLDQMTSLGSLPQKYQHRGDLNCPAQPMFHLGTFLITCDAPLFPGGSLSLADPSQAQSSPSSYYQGFALTNLLFSRQSLRWITRVWN